MPETLVLLVTAPKMKSPSKVSPLAVIRSRSARMRGSCVGRGDKGAEGGDVYEAHVVEDAVVHRLHLARYRVVGGGHQIGGQMVQRTEIVGGTGGDIAHGHVPPAATEPRHHLGEGAVAPEAHHPVIVRATEGGVPFRVPGALGEVGGDQISGVHEGLDHLREGFFEQLSPRHRVHDEQQLLAVLVQQDSFLHIT